MDQSKFRKVVSMLGSDQDGEVLAAARLMRSMAATAKMTITEAIAFSYADIDAVFGVPKGTFNGAVAKAAPAPDPNPQDAGWTRTGGSSRPKQTSPTGIRQDKMMEDFALCRTNYLNRMSAWERNFSEDVLDRWESGKMHNITPAQENVIQRIISKCGV